MARPFQDPTFPEDTRDSAAGAAPARHALRRRAFLGGGLAALVWGALQSGRAWAGEPHAKSCIVLWLNGGPSHLDTFDPKTGAVAGPFRAIDTRVPGMRISEHLPRVAEQADKLCIVRSMTSKEGNHERARHLVHTGYAPNPTVGYPSLGAWLSHELGGASALPPFVSIGGPSAGGGFFGAEHGPFVVPKAGTLPDNVAPTVGEARFARRLELLAFQERGFEAAVKDPDVHTRGAVTARALRLMRSQDLAAFELGDEPSDVQSRYGDSDFGRGCLLARRLVERGVRLVEVVLDGWDTHTDGFTRSEKLMGVLDPGMAALLADLTARGALDSTLVVCLGEFGRTPSINGNEGRDHHPGAWSAVLAGGGLRGGVVHGATDERGEAVVAGAVTVPDLFATIVGQLGLAPDTTQYAPNGRPVAVSDRGQPIAALLRHRTG